jgi:membrane protease YdiL (CAAX protease family)
MPEPAPDGPEPRTRAPDWRFWGVALMLVGAVVAVACLLAAPVHDLLRQTGLMAERPTEAGRVKDFLRVFRRLLLVPLAALFLWRVRPWRDGGLVRFGLRGPRARARPAAVGALLTLLALLAVLAGQVAAGWLRFEDPLRWGEFLRRVAVFSVGGLVLGLIEEWFFRGWLPEKFRARHAGVLLSAAAYALVHAFSATRFDADVPRDAGGALEALLGWLAHMADLEAFGPAALGLFLFALLLTAAYRRTGTLWTPIAIHAVVVLVLSSYGALTWRHPERTWAGTRLLVDGPVTWAMLALGTLCLGFAETVGRGRRGR